MAGEFCEGETLLSSQLLRDEYGSNSESVFSGFGSCGSSYSSDLNTPVGSELDSTETESEEDDFIAELTRQMADYMLQEDDENAAPNCVSEKSQYDCNSVHVNMKKPYSVDQIQPIQFNELRNQQHMKNRGSVCWGRREKTAESTQKLEQEQQLQRKKQQHYNMQNRGRGRGCEFGKGGRIRPLGSSQVGSGMRAIFLEGSGSRSASCGTGVFLPRGTNNAPEPRKKSGCSTVLIPARVLQALELHFNKSSHSNGFTGYQHDVVVGAQQKRQLQSQTRPAKKPQEMQLPQEWTY